VPDKALGLGERVPAGTGHLGLLDTPHVTISGREGVSEVEVEMIRLVLLRPCPDPAVLDIRRDLRDAGHRARVDAGLLRQLALRCAGERGIGRLKVAAGLQEDPVRAVLD
jgi:hypothetical protein